MVTGTVEDLFDMNWNLEDENGESHYIYVVRDGDTVFYVGQGRRPVFRVQAHLGFGAWKKPLDELGRFIEINYPASQSWKIDYLTLTDCQKYIAGDNLDIFMAATAYDVGRAISIAEKALIKSLGTCLNKKHNPNPTPLPPQYLKVNAVRKKVRK